MQENAITIFGPLTVETVFKVRRALLLSNDMYHSTKSSITYGGFLPKIARYLQELGYPQTQLVSYVGSDPDADKIIQMIIDNNIPHIIQKLPETATTTVLKIHNNSHYSKTFTETPALSLWRMRLKHLKIKKRGIIFLDPIIPSEIQIELIEEFKQSTFVVRYPLDAKLDIFQKDFKNLVIVFNEYEAFQVFSKLEIKYFNCSRILQSDLLMPHPVFIETKSFLFTYDREKNITKKINVEELKRPYSSLINSAFFAGLITGIACKQSYENAFLWGTAASILRMKNKSVNKLAIANELIKLIWDIHTE